MSNKNCEVGQSDEKDGAVDELVEGTVGLDLDEPVDETATEDGGDMDGPVEEETIVEDRGAVHKPVGEETMAEDGGPLDEPVEETVGEDDRVLYGPFEEAMAEGSTAVHLAKPNDDLSKANVADEPEGLNEHLQGKKHKLKEAARRAQKAGKNYSIGLFPKEPAKGIKASGTTGPGTDNEVKFTSESSTVSKTGEADSKTDDLPQLQEKSNSDNIRKDKEAGVAQKVSTRKRKVKKKNQFWCELCKVGAPSQKTMKNHLNGKKHKRQLLMSNKNCEVGQYDEMYGAVDELVEETMGGDMDGPMKEETIVEDPRAVHKPVEEETMAEDGGPLDDPVEETVGEDDRALYEPFKEAMAEDSTAVHLAKPNDDLSKVDVADEPEGLNEHLQGKKHKLKEAALRAQKAGKNCSIGLFPKKPAKSIKASGTAGPGTLNEVKFASESSTFSKTGVASSKTDDLQQLQEKSNSDNIRKGEEAVVAQKVSKRKSKVKKKNQLWCELCNVGVPSQKSMENHLNGKKHKR